MIQPLLTVERTVERGAGALALVKPLPPKAVAGRPGFTRATRPRLLSPPANRWVAIQDLALAPSLSPGATSPIRNSIEPILMTGAAASDIASSRAVRINGALPLARIVISVLYYSLGALSIAAKF